MLASITPRRMRRARSRMSATLASLPLWARVSALNIIGAMAIFVLVGYFFEGVTQGKVSDFARKADFDLQEKTLENQILDARLASTTGRLVGGGYTPRPGLHVEVFDRDWKLLWSSLPDQEVTFDRHSPPGKIEYPRDETVFEQFERYSGEGQFALATYVGTCNEASEPCIFRVSRRMQRDGGEVDSHALLSPWILLAFLVVFPVQMFLVHRTFVPIKRLVGEIREIGARHRGPLQQGAGSDRVSGSYPADVQILADRLNELIDEDRRKIEEARGMLENLRHDLNHLARPQGDFESAFRNVLDAYIRVFVHFSKTIPPHVDVQRLVKVCRAGFVEMYADRPRPLDIDSGEDSVWVRADEGVLKLILTNLLSNACKFANQQVRIRASVDKKQPTTLILLVEDDGPRSPTKEDVDVALRRGGRIDPERGGTGLGLSNIERMVNQLSGDLRIDASELGGWRVRVRLDWWLRSRMGSGERHARGA